jgi:hypothetical protein
MPEYEFNLNNFVVRITDNDKVYVEFERDSEILKELQDVVAQLEKPPEGETREAPDEVASLFGSLLYELGRRLQREGVDFLDGGNAPPSLH